jgi:predicted ABC-type transport system involved in lysophospholipase L1 biosynthesis ATPase subunit
VPLEIWPKVDALARLVGIDESVWDAPAGAAGAVVQARTRLGRALALQPSLIVAEHPSLGLPREAVGAVAADLGSIARARGFAVLALTADRAFAEALVGRRFSFNAASGELTAAGGLLDKVSRLFR